MKENIQYNCQAAPELRLHGNNYRLLPNQAKWLRIIDEYNGNWAANFSRRVGGGSIGSLCKRDLRQRDVTFYRAFSGLTVV